MDQEMERQMRDVLAKERFGVLATLFGGRLHTATIHFAETDDLELIHAIRRDTLKAEQAAANPRVVFQVDNRGILMESRDRFARISIEGTLHQVPEDDPDYEGYRRTFADKLPVGDRLLAHPEIALYILRPSVIRLAIGAATAEDITVTYEVDAAPAAGNDAAWRNPHNDADVTATQ
ncbi:MAG: pyridoxamine 5'-phosphate oxidase family protein [Dehalococcoidia bacterium]